MASPPRMPVIDILPRRRTAHLSLGPIPYDESTNAGNIDVLRNIFQEQYQLPDEAFNDQLFLIYGDQKTTQRIRMIKSRRSRAARPVDSLRWGIACASSLSRKDELPLYAKPDSFRCSR